MSRSHCRTAAGDWGISIDPKNRSSLTAKTRRRKEMGLAGMGGFIAKLAKQGHKIHLVFTCSVTGRIPIAHCFSFAFFAPLRFKCFF